MTPRFLSVPALRQPGLLAVWLLALAFPATLAAQRADPFAYDTGIPAEWQDSLVGQEAGIAEYRISFASPKGGRVTGRLFAPTQRLSAQRLPALILGHGAPGSTANMEPRARYFAAKGMLVVGIDAAFARRDPRSPLSFAVQDSIDQVQTLVDLRRLVDLLVAREDVDAARMAYLGISYGAALGGVLAGIEPRLRAYILAVGDLGFVPHFKDADGRWMDEMLPPMPAEELGRWERAMTPVSGSSWFSRADASALFLQSNQRDEAVLPHVARQFHAAAPAGTRIRWYDSTHRLTPLHYVDHLQFLHERLGTPAPTAADSAGPRFPAPPPRAP